MKRRKLKRIARKKEQNKELQQLKNFWKSKQIIFPVSQKNIPEIKFVQLLFGMPIIWP